MTSGNGIRKGLWLRAAALLAAFIAAYWIPLRAMVATWSSSDDYSYGFLIPMVSAYLIWDMRGRLDGARVASSWAMLPVLVLLVLLSIYGILGSSGNISMPSVPLLVIAFTAFCFGLDMARRLILPLGFLVFMVPIPAVFERTIGMYLKSISSQLGGAIIQFFNISAHVSGNVIDLGVTQLQVVDACNGLRYIFPLLALGIIYAYFFERVMWKRVACVLATIPIAILTNALRIGLTGILTHFFGAGVAEGFFHGFSGWVMFLVAFFVLFILGRVLRLFPPKHGEMKAPEPQREARPAQPAGEGGTAVTRALMTSLVILAVVAGLSLSTKALPPIGMKGSIASFPLSFQGWTGQAQFVPPDIIDASGAEEAFSAGYRDEGGREVSLYIGYRGTAFMAVENFFHSPTVCLPSSGWIAESTSTRVIEDVPMWGRLKVSRMIVSHLGDRSVVYFWFQTKDKHSHDKNINRFDLAMHAIRRDNTYDMFIRTIANVQPGGTVEETEREMDAFVRDMLATLQKFVRENQTTGME